MMSLALALLAAVAAHDENTSGPDADMIRLLDRTVWIDIGPGRKLKTLTPQQIAELRTCKEPTMILQKNGGAWTQSFYAGVEMRTVYSSATLKTEAAGTTILFYSAGHSAPTETLRLTPRGDVLVEQTRGFRPRTFLKCNPPKAETKTP
jgi:hypothetical protein